MSDSKQPVIMHLATAFVYGGAEIMQVRTFAHLKGGKQVLVLMRDQYDPGLIERVKSAGLKVHILGAKWLWDFRAILKFRKLIKEYRPKMISTSLLHANIFGRIIGRLFGVKYIFCCLPAKHKGPRFFFYWLAETSTSFLVNQYYAVSKSVKEYHHRLYLIPNRKLTVIYNGVDQKLFQQPVDRDKVRKSLGASEDDFLMAVVGRLSEQKGHIYLIEAIDKLRKEIPNMKVAFLGEGPERKEIEDAVKAHKLEDIISLPGNRTDIPDVLNSIDLFVLPTLFEGLCNAIIEAMAAGCTILTTDIPENLELVKHNESAYLVPPKNSVKLEEALRKLYNDPDERKRLAKNAEKASEEFSLQKSIDNLNKVYEGVPRR